MGSNPEWYEVQMTSSSYFKAGFPLLGSSPKACQHSSSERAKNCQGAHNCPLMERSRIQLPGRGDGPDLIRMYATWKT